MSEALDWTFTAQLTPVEEQPYKVNEALCLACQEFAPEAVIYARRLEVVQRHYDRSYGDSMSAAKEIEHLSGQLWRIIYQATSHRAIRLAAQTSLPKDLESGMPGTYDIPEAYSHDFND